MMRCIGQMSGINTEKRVTKNEFSVTLFSVPYVGKKLFLLVGVSLVEFVNAACGIDEFHLTCIERV